MFLLNNIEYMVRVLVKLRKTGASAYNFSQRTDRPLKGDVLVKKEEKANKYKRICWEAETR